MSSMLLTLVLTVSLKHGIDPYIVLGLIETESRFNSNATGGLGEQGLMQLRPEFFKRKLRSKTLIANTIELQLFGVPINSRMGLYDPALNVMIGVEYLASLKRVCRHREDNTYIVCFNQGPVKGGHIRSPRKNAYYRKVMLAASKFRTKRIFSAGNLSREKFQKRMILASF